MLYASWLCVAWFIFLDNRRRSRPYECYVPSRSRFGSGQIAYQVICEGRTHWISFTFLTIRRGGNESSMPEM